MTPSIQKILGSRITYAGKEYHEMIRRRQMLNQRPRIDLKNDKYKIYREQKKHPEYKAMLDKMRYWYMRGKVL